MTHFSQYGDTKHTDERVDPATEETIVMMEKGRERKTEYWKRVFDHYDQDHDGSIPLKEFREELLLSTNIRHEVPESVLTKILIRADKDQNGHLDFREFIDLVNSPALTPAARRAIGYLNQYATKLVLPRNKWREIDVVDARYFSEFNCWPPPITIFLVTLAEVAVFIYYALDAGYVTASGPVPFESPLIYDPYRRYEAWRYFSYMLIHAGCIHILFNMVIQLLLGIPLEMVHKFWRVWLVYIAGVFAGSLGTSISDPKVFLAGASGGVYALITGHLATIIMNFQEMEFAVFQLVGFLFLMLFDFGVALYYRYIAESADKTTGYAAHLGGAFAGFFVGIVALRNLEQRKWEKPLWWVSLVIVVIAFLVMIIWNAAFPSYFFPPK